MTLGHTLIFTGGDGPHSLVFPHLPSDAFIIAADSGYEHAVSSGHQPHLLVGDMDSISAAHLADARVLGIEIEEHQSNKDLTDTELAVTAALERGATAITIVAGGGDRFDHVIGLLHSLASFSPRALTTVFIGTARITFTSPGDLRTITTTVNDTVSLIPLGGDVVVSTTGLQWNLMNETLRAFASRGVSNRAIHATITVHATAGILAIIQPFFLSPGVTQ
jgi:thiamine pyrophosphokinase